MRRWWWLVIGVALGMGVALVRPATAGEEPGIFRYGVGGKLVSGEWAFGFFAGEVPPALVAETGPVTGFAFGPGRSEIAYCAPAGGECWGMWVASVSLEGLEDWDGWPALPPGTAAPPRVLWTAPEGVILKGPVWWAPDGSTIALQAERAAEPDVLAVDYGTGEVVRLCRGVKVAELAWDPRGRRIAYVTEDEGGRAVWLQTMPAGEARRLGEGGFNLRWSLDGGSLRWLRPTSERVWVAMTWDAETREVSEANPQPARTPGSMQSPDGQVYASLESWGEGDEKQLVLYPTTSTAGDRVLLPNVLPRQLLGWSPDSRVVLLLGDMNFPVAVAARPISDGVQVLVEASGRYGSDRAALCGLPMDAEAGPPSWSSGGDMLAYVIAKRFDERMGWPADESFATGGLVVSQVGREHIEPVGEERVEAEQVLTNMKNVALALQMYLSDNNDAFPPSGESEEVWRILDEYVENRRVFMRPGTEDEMVVQYLVPPGVRMVDIEDTASTPVAVVDYLPGFYVVGYADGHAAVHGKKGDYWQELAAPWWEYELQQVQEEQ
jgi:hypothetical protein